MVRTVDRLDDILQFSQVFLPDPAAPAINPGPLGIVIISVAVNLLRLQPFHDLPPCQRVEKPQFRGYEVLTKGQFIEKNLIII